MSECIATLVAPGGLTSGDVSAACDAVRGVAEPVVDGVACRIAFDGGLHDAVNRSPELVEGRLATPRDALRQAQGYGSPEANAPAFAGARLALEAAVPHADVFVRPADAPAPRLLVADMDSTMITVECIDELADYAGIKPQIAAITERAMRGELDFAAALRERVGCLTGLEDSVIDRCLAERVRPMAGAATTIRTLRVLGVRCVLVSGGFTRFADPVAGSIGFDHAVANRLEIDGGRLTGQVLPPIVDAAAKKATLEAEAARLGAPLLACIAVGDGANDVPMIEAAGLGIAYHGHARAVAAADARIRVGDHTSLLYALGIPRAAWVA